MHRSAASPLGSMRLYVPNRAWKLHITSGPAPSGQRLVVRVPAVAVSVGHGARRRGNELVKRIAEVGESNAAQVFRPVEAIASTGSSGVFLRAPTSIRPERESPIVVRIDVLEPPAKHHQTGTAAFVRRLVICLSCNELGSESEYMSQPTTPEYSSTPLAQRLVPGLVTLRAREAARFLARARQSSMTSAGAR
jgi:hypothetical protein